MAYVKKNLKLTIKRPGYAGEKIVFSTPATANDHFRIPRRFPFLDISNYATLKTAGYFRHLTNTVSAELGGVITAGEEANLGFELPNTEKLILLVKKGATAEESLVIEGSIEYGIDDLTVVLPAGAIGDLYEVDLYDFGLYITGVAGEKGIMIKMVSALVSIALVARMA